MRATYTHACILICDAYLPVTHFIIPTRLWTLLFSRLGDTYVRLGCCAMGSISLGELTCQSPQPTSPGCLLHGQLPETPGASGHGQAGPRPWRARLLRLPGREKGLARYSCA